ncbi:MAG: retention module-containing protein, partial [Pseudomonas sp.]
MSTVIAIVKSIIGQVFAVSPDGGQRLLVEGDRVFLGETVSTGSGGMVTLALNDGTELDLGRHSEWVANNSGSLRISSGEPAPSVEELQQAIAAGLDPTLAFEPTAAGEGSTEAGSGGGGRDALMLTETAQRLTPEVGFPTQGVLFSANNVFIESGATLPQAEAPSLPEKLAPGLTIVEDINGDGIINADELDGDIDVLVTLPDDANPGDTLTVSDGSSSQTIILTPEDIENGSVNVSFPPPADGETITVTGSISDSSGNSSPETTTSATLDLSPPSAPGVTIVEDSNGDGVINADELDGDIDVLITLPADAEAGDTLVISDGTTTQTVVLTPEQIADGSVSTSFPPPAEGETITVTANITDPAGNTGADGSSSALLDTTAPGAPSVVISEDSNNDGFINADELDGDIDVLITLPGDAEAGDTLTVTDGTETQTFVLTPEQIADGSITTTFTPPAEGETITITATVTDPAGNTGPEGTDSALLDTTAPGAPVVVITEDTNNDGFINADELDGDIDVEITIPGDAQAGDTLTVTDGTETQTFVLTPEQIAEGS